MNADGKTGMDDPPGDKMKVLFAYRLGAPVRIINAGIRGHIDAAIVEGRELQYRVVHWLGGERKTVWVTGSEIERDEGAAPMGFK